MLGLQVIYLLLFCQIFFIKEEYRGELVLEIETVEYNEELAQKNLEEYDWSNQPENEKDGE